MTDDAPSNSTPPDNSSFVEHLRLVHFTLIAACLILSIAVTSQQPSLATRAYEQAIQLRRIQDVWQNGKWLREFMDQQQARIIERQHLTNWQAFTLKLSEPPKYPFSFFYKPAKDIFEDNHQLFLLRPTWVLSNKTIVAGGTSWLAASHPELYPHELDINTLADMVRIWDKLYEFGNIVTLTALHGGWVVDHRQGSSPARLTKLADNATPYASEQIREFSRDLSPGIILRNDLLDSLALRNDLLSSVGRKNNAPISQIPVEPLSQLISEAKDTECFLLDLFDLNREVALLVRGECFSERVSVQLILTRTLPSVPSIGDFSQSFPDLADLAKHLQTLSLGDVETFFHTAMARSGETVELPGVKLPGEAVTSWGIVIIVIIEVYFFVIFREFCSRVILGDKAWNVPWIGISRDVISRVAFAISILIVLCTVGYLSWRGARVAENIWLIALYVVAIVLSVATVGDIFWRWASLPIERSNAVQPFE
jgi:hypothetical protein